MQPSGPSGAPAMPFSELGELSGVPNQPQIDLASVPSVSQVKAKSALGAFAAQRVAGLAQPALHLVENALAAGRRGVPSLHSHVALCSYSLCAGMHIMPCPDCFVQQDRPQPYIYAAC